MHTTILAVVILGLPSLTLVLPEWKPQEPELRVVMVTEQEAAELEKKPKKDAKPADREAENKAPVEDEKSVDGAETPPSEATREWAAEAPPTPPTDEPAEETPLASAGISEQQAPADPLAGHSVVKEAAPRSELDGERAATRNRAPEPEEGKATAGTAADIMRTSDQTESPAAKARHAQAGAPQARAETSTVEETQAPPSEPGLGEMAAAAQFLPPSPIDIPSSELKPEPTKEEKAERKETEAKKREEEKPEPPTATAADGDARTVRSDMQLALAETPSGEKIQVAQQKGENEVKNDAVTKLMADFAEQIPRLKHIRDTIHGNDSARANPAMAQTVERMEERSQEGYSHAQFSLAEMHLTGDGVPKDFKKGAELLTRAAMGGYLPAQLTLGMLAAEGTEIERNLAEAHTWLAVAAEQGNEPAKQMLPKLEKHMSTRDTVEARKRSFQLHQVLVIIHGGDLENASKTELSERLRVAAALGDVESVYVLLAQGADADSADEEGRTPLIESSWRGYHKIVKSLIDNGANLSSADNTGKTALMWAAINGHAAVIANLLAAGSPIDAADNEGITALMRAAWNSHVEAVKVLANADAKVALKDKKGLTAIDYAGKAGNAQIQNILRQEMSGG